MPNDKPPMTVQEMGRLGGEARAKRLSPERRTAIARKGGVARAKKAGQKLRGKRKQR